MVSIGLFYSIHDSTEVAIQKIIGAQRMKSVNNNSQEEKEAVSRI
jgi:hypothetical protein